MGGKKQQKYYNLILLIDLESSNLANGVGIVFTKGNLQKKNCKIYDNLLISVVT